MVRRLLRSTAVGACAALLLSWTAIPGTAPTAMARAGAAKVEPAALQPVPSRTVDGAALSLPPATAVLGNSLTRSAVRSRLAERSLLLDIAAAGRRLVAVGERGRVLLSDDAGRTWRQARDVPVSVTLTALCFVDAQQGWAVGHGAVVLHTADGGETWALQLDGIRAAQQVSRLAATVPGDDARKRSADLLVADGPDKPFLAVHFRSAQTGLAVGAYGLVFSTDDGGAHWQPRMADTDNPKGLHLNAIIDVGQQTWIAGERGLLLRSDDAGGRFTGMPSPYDGSWFAGGASATRGITLAGLRGNLYNSRDDGASWQKLDSAGGQTFDAAREVGDNLLLVNQSGALYALDAGLHLSLLDARPAPTAMTGLVAAGDGVLVAATLRGPVRLAAGVGLVAGR